MPTGRRRKTGPRGNESPKANNPETSVPQNHRKAPESKNLWEGVTIADLRDIVDRYGYLQLRFPVTVVELLLDEIDRLEEGLDGQTRSNRDGKSGNRHQQLSGQASSRS